MNHLAFGAHLEDNEEYYRKLTSSWREEDKEGEVALYVFHDGVDWEHHYAIVVKNEVKHVLKDMEYHQAHLVYQAVVNCFK